MANAITHLRPETKAQLEESHSKAVDNNADVRLQFDGRMSQNEVDSIGAGASMFGGHSSQTDNLRHDTQFHAREELIRPVSDSNDAKGVLREGDKGLEIIGSPKSVWHENDGNEFNGINKRDLLQSGDDITTGGVNAHGLSASKDFNKAVAGNGGLIAQIETPAQLNQTVEHAASQRVAQLDQSMSL